MNEEKQHPNHIPAPQDKKVYVEQMFTAIAPTYDLLNRILSFGRDERWRRQAAQYYKVDTGLVLDVATGTGKMASILARHPGVTRVVGLDFTTAMLFRAKAMLEKQKRNSTIDLIQGDAQNLPFPDATFDCVTITYALRNVTDISKTFSEMTRVVRPGGRVISLELTRPRQGLFQKLYYFYMHRIAPILGGLISHKREAYKYLPDSIMIFPTPQEIKTIMEKVGLGEVTIQSLMGGAATIQIGTRTLI
jgi:demethylmenaquinone methyltransferase / 2-methoxy-6-polyprenyl-1,4-benzoquinol methylase